MAATLQTNGLFYHCLCVIDVMGSGSLSHSMSMPSSAPMLSPDGYSLLIETWWGLTVRDLPSLHCKFELARPLLSSSNTVSKLAEHLQWWTGGTSGTASILCIWGSQETPAAHLVAIFDAHCGAELHTHLIDFREITGDTYQVTDFLSSFSAKAAPDQPYVAISIGVRAVSSQQIQTFMGDLLAVLDVTTGELVPVGTGLFRDNLVTVYAWSPTGTHLAITEIWYGDARAFHIWDASLRALIHTVDTNEGYRQHACWSPRGGFCVDPTSLELLQVEELRSEFLNGRKSSAARPRLAPCMRDHAKKEPLRLQTQGCELVMSISGGLLVELRQTDDWQAYLQQFRLGVQGGHGWIWPDRVPEMQLKARCCVPLVAWCPCPAALHIYAVADDACEMHLLNGRSAELLGTWALEPSAMGDQPAHGRDPQELQKLQWSPDGMKLAFCGHDAVCLVRFDR